MQILLNIKLLKILGEYVSLGKVESVLKIHSVIDQICVYAKPTESFTVGLVVPDEAKLMNLASKMVTKEGVTFEDLCSDPLIIKELLKQILTHGLSMGLEKFEIPKQIALIHEQWTPDSGMVTAATVKQCGKKSLYVYVPDNYVIISSFRNKKRYKKKSCSSEKKSCSSEKKSCSSEKKSCCSSK